MDLPYKSNLRKLWNAEGEAKGEERGEAKGRAESIISVLSARGLPVSGEVASQIRAISDFTVLDGLLARAVMVERAEDLISGSE